MPDVTFDGSEDGTMRRVAPKSHQADEFRLVSQRRAGRVAFDVIHRVRRPVSLSVRRLKCSQLAFAAWSQEVSLDIIRQPDSMDHTKNLIAGFDCIRQP